MSVKRGEAIVFWDCPARKDFSSSSVIEYHLIEFTEHYIINNFIKSYKNRIALVRARRSKPAGPAQIVGTCINKTSMVLALLLRT